MIATLKRTTFSEDGIFGHLTMADLDLFTLEHAFVRYTLHNNKAQWLPKVAPGSYQCVRGIHRLEHMQSPFITFELQNVPDFQSQPVSGILFHSGNFNKDSNGCILLGIGYDLQTPMITQSRLAFAEFMHDLDGINEFDLLIT